MSVAIKKWDGAADTTSNESRYIKTRDDDCGSPRNIKKGYAVIVTYRNGSTINMNAFLKYALNGSTTYVTTYIPSTSLAAATDWDVAKIEFSTILEFQSISLQVIDTDDFEINDITIDYRHIHRRVT